MKLDLRPSPIAGTWYEGNPKTLAAQIDTFIADAVIPPTAGKVIGVIAPHAGHRFSGRVAGYAFRAIQNMEADLAVVVSPFHNYAPHPILTSAHQGYATPLGAVEIDKDALRELQSDLEIPITAVAKDKEHSLEIELPFLQRAIKNQFKLLPLMMRAQERGTARKLGSAIAHILKDKNAILVASTDLSHFYDQKTAEKLDAEMLKRFESFNPELIFEAEEKEIAFACGHAAVATVFYAARELGAKTVQILKHATSGTETQDYSSVVGYGAAVIVK
jgi:AmmeMemoRadiSam system protein B